MKKKNIIGKLGLSPLYILKGIWDWSGQMEDEPEEIEKFYCKYCGFESRSLRGLLFGDCVLHPDGNGKDHCLPYEGSLKSTYAWR